MIEDIPITPQTIKKAIAISKLSPVFRTGEENQLFVSILSQFDFIQKKVHPDCYHEALLAAASSFKHLRVPAGKFLYHIDRTSNFIYFILSGEAWEFREKTRYEIDTDKAMQNQKKETLVPRFLETVDLAKKSKDRKQILGARSPRGKASVHQPASQPILQPQPVPAPSIPTIIIKPPSMHQNDITEGKDPNRYIYVKEASMFLSNNQNKINDKNLLSPAVKEDMSFGRGKYEDKEMPVKGKPSLFDKIKQKRSVLTFENEYFFNLIKRNQELNAKYIKNGLVMMKFYEKYDAFRTIGEITVNVAYSPPGAVLASTPLDVLVLDQAGFDKVFTNQSADARLKFRFFQDLFPEVSYDELKKLCGLFAEQKFKLNDTIYNENSPCDFLYFIKSGEVQLFKMVETKKPVVTGVEQNKMSRKGFREQSSNNVKPVLITNIFNTQFFGEEVLFEDSTRRFTAKCISNVTCFKISQEVLSMVPEIIVKELTKLSVSKQTWRKERLGTIISKIPKEMNEMSLEEFKKVLKTQKSPKQDLKISFTKEKMENDILQLTAEKTVVEETEPTITDLEDPAQNAKAWRKEMCQVPLSALLQKNDMLTEISPKKKEDKSFTENKELNSSYRLGELKSIFSLKPTEVATVTPKTCKQAPDDYMSSFFQKYDMEQVLTNRASTSKSQKIKRIEPVSAGQKSRDNRDNRESLISRSGKVYPTLRELDKTSNYFIIHSDRESSVKKIRGRNPGDQTTVSRFLEDSQRGSLLISPQRERVRKVGTLKDDLIQSFWDKSREKIRSNTALESGDKTNTTLAIVQPKAPNMFTNLIKNVSYVSPKNKGSLVLQSTDSIIQVQSKNETREKPLISWSQRFSVRNDGVKVNSIKFGEDLSSVRNMTSQKRTRVPNLKVATSKPFLEFV